MPLKHLAHYAKLSLKMLVCPLPPKGWYSVLLLLLYGGECWIPLKKHQKRLNTFHHRCIHTILGIICTQQWEEHISSRMMREQWEMRRP